jgi:predicted hydrocarbon binding protein
VVPFGKLAPIVYRIDSSLGKALVTAHERYGHVSPKKLVYFKKKGRVHSSIISVRGALDFKVKDCPVCAVMKRNRAKKPASPHVEEKRQ